MKNRTMDVYYIVSKSEENKVSWLFQYGVYELDTGQAEAAVVHVFADDTERYIESALYDEIPSWQDVANTDKWETWIMPDSEQVFYNFIDEMLSVLGEPDYQFEA